jgi:hypothetical protein
VWASRPAVIGAVRVDGVLGSAFDQGRGSSSITYDDVAFSFLAVLRISCAKRDFTPVLLIVMPAITCRVPQPDNSFDRDGVLVMTSGQV